MEECAGDMGQMSNYAAVTGAQIMLRMKDCASGMGQRSNYAAVTGAQIMLKEEDCARDMGQRSFAAAKDVRIKWYVEECAGDMGLGGGGDESTTTPW